MLILNLEDVAVYGLRFLEVQYPHRLKEWFNLEGNFLDDTVVFFDQIGEKKRSLYWVKREIDYDKVTEFIIRDIRNEKFGPLSLERP